MRNIDQLELGLDKGLFLCPPAQQKQHRTQRAQWWFRQMRRVVNMAIEWRPAPPARPEQAYLTMVPKQS
jgi:hypothetical protein